jgi:hypothetical protein
MNEQDFQQILAGPSPSEIQAKKEQCTTSPLGSSVSIHPDESLLQFDLRRTAVVHNLHNKIKSIFSKTLWSGLCLILLSWGLVSCRDTIDSVRAFGTDSASRIPKAEQIAEVPPPSLIQELGKIFDQYQPQVTILSPQNGRVFEDTTVEVELQVRDLPLFKNEELGLGPHLNFFVDNQPYQAIYSTDEPIILENLAPGTHTIRVFASRPWHESFKNEGAYAQTTFHIFTPTDDNHPEPNLPLLTYSRPQGTYGAEPIMVDFYLTNAPLHLVAQSDSQDEIADWRIRVTVNGESFLMDTWQPIYLTGFHPGENWVQLEFIDENGNPVKNAFNNTVRVINYARQQEDTLAQLVTGKLSLARAKAIADPNYRLEETSAPVETTTETTPVPPTKTQESEPQAETPVETQESEPQAETPVETQESEPQAETPVETQESEPQVETPVETEALTAETREEKTSSLPEETSEEEEISLENASAPEKSEN